MTTTALEYETVIGLEVHAQLLTKSKMFCPCSSDYADSPANTHVCPICLGLPGVLPTINKQAVEMTIMTGLALNCEILPEAKFDRKNYPYPDLMKGYQISQYDLPIARNGCLEIEVEGTEKRVRITRVHLEEDTARLLHRKEASGDTYSLVDVNRSGVPLMEIVSEPDMRSPEEARAYLIKLQQILRYIGASRANMEEGNMRCEPNVSVRPHGSSDLGTKVELKNINSFRHVYDAINYEVQRQTQVLSAGGRVLQETRGWREDSGEAVSQRSKEFSHDYRYFPEPDLPPLIIDREWVDEIHRRMPELPDAKKARFQAHYGLSDYDAALLTESPARAGFLEAVVALAPAPKRQQRAKAAANWILSDFAGLLHTHKLEIEQSKITPQALAELIDLLDSDTISGKIAKTVFEEMFASGRSAQEIVRQRGLVQITAADEIEAAVAAVLAANPKAAADYRQGKQEALRFLVGQVMRETKGRANPALANELLLDKLQGGP